jgi:hypothetical protein
LTKTRARRLSVPVSTLLRFVSLVLLAVWLPATQHCELQAAGLIAAEIPHSEDDDCHGLGDGHCNHDGCDLVERSVIKSSNDTIKAPLPTLIDCAGFLGGLLPRERIVVREPTPIPALAAAAQSWVPLRHFVRRAAPLSRAPSHLG